MTRDRSATTYDFHFQVPEYRDANKKLMIKFKKTKSVWEQRVFEKDMNFSIYYDDGSPDPV